MRLIPIVSTAALAALAAFAAFTSLTGCAASTATSDESASASEADVRASSGGFRLTLASSGPSAGRYGFTGNANQSLDGAFAFVPDDEVGTTTFAAQHFTTTFAATELHAFAKGQPIFFSVDPAGPASFAARADVRVAPVPSHGTGFQLDPTFQVFIVGGAEMVRVSGSFTSRLVGATAAFIGPDPKPSWTGVVHGSTFHVDVPLDRVAVAVVGAAKLGIVVGTRYDDFSFAFTPTMKVTRLALTTGDAYQVWPSPTCDAAILACLRAPANAVDTSACGDAFHVQGCLTHP